MNKYEEGNVLKIPGFIVKIKKAVPLGNGKSNLLCSFGISDTDDSCSFFTDEWISVRDESVSLYAPIKTEFCTSCKKFGDMWRCGDCLSGSLFIPNDYLKQVLLLNGWDFTDKKPIRVVLGFPGVGKTYAKNALSSRYRVLDLDSNGFKGGSNFPQNYIDSIEDCIKREDYDLIFISAEESVCDFIQGCSTIMDHAALFICYPAAYLKEDWLEMLMNNGYDIESLSYIRENFEKWIKAIDSFGWCRKIKLHYMDDSVLGRLRETKIVPFGDDYPCKY